MPYACDEGAEDEPNRGGDQCRPGSPAQGTGFLVNGVEGRATGIVAEAEKHEA